MSHKTVSLVFERILLEHLSVIKIEILSLKKGNEDKREKRLGNFRA